MINVMQQYERIVVKVGTSTLTHDTGRLNLERIERLVQQLSDMRNAGKEIVLVSSGAVSAGIARLNLNRRPASTEEKQALAAVGQSQLMNIYVSFFGRYGHQVGQILMTKDVIDNPVRFKEARNTFMSLLSLGVTPIVNENDSVSTDGINFGGNDTLAAYVALICDADLVINLSDIDALYDSDPRKNPAARRIHRVDKVDERILSMAGGAGTDRGTGGMLTKLEAAKLVTEAGIPMIIANGHDPAILSALLRGEELGTTFAAQPADERQ